MKLTRLLQLVVVFEETALFVGVFLSGKGKEIEELIRWGDDRAVRVSRQSDQPSSMCTGRERGTIREIAGLRHNRQAWLVVAEPLDKRRCVEQREPGTG